MRLASIACLLVCAAGAFGSSARGQQIEKVSGIGGLPHGVIGTSLEIVGIGFGTARPKVTLTDPQTGKVYRLKVTAHSELFITAEIRKAVAGELLLAVDPKGKAAGPISAPQAFTVLAPEIHKAGHSETKGKVAVALAGGNVILYGAHFGTDKGTVRVGGKKAKVAYWSDDTVSVTIPEQTAAGLRTFVLTNGAGTCALDLLIAPPPDSLTCVKPPKVSLNLSVDGVPIACSSLFANFGSIVSPETGLEQSFLDVQGFTVIGKHWVRCVVLRDAALGVPFLVQAPLQPQADTTVLFYVTGLFAPAGPGDEAPAPPVDVYLPADPFVLSVTALDPVLHTAELQMSGTLEQAPGTSPTLQVSGSISVAP